MQVFGPVAMASHQETQETFLFLGTSTSVGVPVIGCSCPTCTSTHPHDQRSRASATISGPWGKILIDSGPDLRQQALREHLTCIDAILYTHEHLDHVTGFDELRAFCWHRTEPLPFYGSPETLAALERMFPWAFSPKNTVPGYVRPQKFPVEAPFFFQSLKITPIEVQHAQVRTYGYRFDTPNGHALAYLPDVKSIPAASLHLLQHLDTLIIDALRFDPHSTHMTIPEALETITTLQPQHTYLTHLSHEPHRPTLEKSLPQNVSLAYDGLSLKL